MEESQDKEAYFDDLKVKVENKQAVNSAEAEQNMSSVIIRRQVITTAGTIEQPPPEPKIEQVAAEEVVKTSTSTPLNGSPQEPSPVASQDIQQYEEHSTLAEVQYEVEPQHFSEQGVVSTEQYSTANQEYSQEQPIEYTTTIETANIQGSVPHIQIEGVQFSESHDDVKVSVKYTDLDSVSSAQYQASHFTADGNQYLHQPQYQQYQSYGIAQGPDDSPPNSVLYKSDPNLSAARIYQVSYFRFASQYWF